MEGPIAGPPIVIHVGAARAITVDAQAGSEGLRRAQVASLSTTAHPAVTTPLARERVRLVGLRSRPDGMLMPTQRTVLTRVVDLSRVAAAMGQMVGHRTF